MTNSTNPEGQLPSQSRPKCARPAPVRPPIVDVQADVALVDINDVKALVRAGESWVYSAMSRGDFPKPAIRRPRFVRWLLADVRRWLIAQASAAAGAATTTERAKHASAAARDARTKRRQPAAVAATE